jgi:hypothetical protein
MVEVQTDSPCVLPLIVYQSSFMCGSYWSLVQFIPFYNVTRGLFQFLVQWMVVMFNPWIIFTMTSFWHGSWCRSMVLESWNAHEHNLFISML